MLLNWPHWRRQRLVSVGAFVAVVDKCGSVPWSLRHCFSSEASEIGVLSEGHMRCHGALVLSFVFHASSQFGRSSTVLCTTQHGALRL